MRFLASAAAALALLALQAVTARAAAPGGPRTLTLITGDQLLIASADGKSVTVRPRAGREDIVFETDYEYSAGDRKEHVYVTPADALELIGEGKLDRELFDVTELLDSHYDDAARKDVPLIVTYEPAQVRSFSAASVSMAGATITHRLSSVAGEAVSAPKRQVGNLWDLLTGTPSAKTTLTATAGAVKKIWLDRLLHPVLDRSVVQIGAPTAWAAGYTGTGIAVAVVDTGVDATHPDLAGKVIAQQNFVSDLDPDVTDHFGHGTHVASIIAGTGAASSGKYRGVAPDAQIISAKVCIAGGCLESAVIAGMEWAVTQAGARIVNMSLSHSATIEVDPEEQAVNNLTAQYGALFVMSAGNTGPASGTVTSGSIADAALSVAAVDRSDQIAEFSSRGPRQRDYAVKPEISAPGVGIVAARAAGTNLGSPVGDAYTTLSGTSMAAPHVAGAAALLKQLHPQWSPAQLKEMLMGSAKFSPTTAVIDQGAGRVDVAAAFASSLLSEPASLNMGLARFPHNQVITRTVNYRNVGTADVTLTLTTEVTGPDGQAAAPAGMFTVTPATLNVPAGGTAAATLSLDDRVSAPIGLYTGRVIASAAGKTVSTPLSIQREEESYDLAIRHINFDGTPSINYTTTFVPLFEHPIWSLQSNPHVPDEVTLRLPVGRYRVEARILPKRNAAPANKTVAIFVQTLDIRAPGSVAFDARTASPVTLRKPTQTAQAIGTVFGLEYTLSWRRPVRTELLLATPFLQPETLYFSSGTEPAPGLTSWISRQWVDTATPTPPQTDAPLYAATWVEHEKLPTGPEKILPLANAAVAGASYFSAVPALSSGLLTIGSLVNSTPDAIRYGLPQSITLPGHRTEYYYSNEEPAVSWAGGLSVLNTSDPESVITVGDLTAQPRRLQAHRFYETLWNQPVFGPAFPATGTATFASTRQGDDLSIYTSLHSDRAGHLGTVGDDNPTGAGHHYRFYQNGQLILDAVGGRGVFKHVPPETATYRLEAEATQTAYGLSSRVSAAWNFQSAHVEGNTPAALPLMSVRFYPDLDPSGQAFRGVRFALPFTVNQVSVASQQSTQCLADLDPPVITDIKPPEDGWPCPDNIRQVTVEVSFDDGVSWSTVPARRFGRLWIAELTHPASAQFVSLRSSASDYSGNSTEQTVIRAYGLIDPPQALKR